VSSLARIDTCATRSRATRFNLAMSYSFVTMRKLALLRALVTLVTCVFAMQTTSAMTEADPKKIFPDPKAAALAEAAAEGDAAKVKALVASGADPNGT
jgi:hypothetical protein